MSVQVSAKVWQLRDLSPVEKLVLLKLADCADDQGRNAWPSVATIAADCGVSRASVTRSLAVLRRRGLIVPVRRGGRHSSVNYDVLRRLTVSHMKAQAEPPPRLTVSTMKAHSEPQTVIEPSEFESFLETIPPNPPVGGAPERARQGSRRKRDVIALRATYADVPVREGCERYKGSLSDCLHLHGPDERHWCRPCRAALRAQEDAEAVS